MFRFFVPCHRCHLCLSSRRHVLLKFFSGPSPPTLLFLFLLWPFLRFLFFCGLSSLRCGFRRFIACDFVALPWIPALCDFRHFVTCGSALLRRGLWRFLVCSSTISWLALRAVRCSYWPNLKPLYLVRRVQLPCCHSSVLLFV